MKSLSILLICCAFMACTGAAVHAQTPTPTASPTEASQTPPPAAPTDVPPTAEPSPTLGLPDPATPFPTPGAATSASIGGVLIEDWDEDGQVSAGDRPAQTLVALLIPGGGFSMLSADDGSWRYENIPAGTWLLTIYWGPGGFVTDVPTATTHPTLAIIEFTVTDDGSVRGDIPAQILLKKRPSESIIPYPVRTGSAPGDLIAVGVIDVGAILAGRSPGRSPSALPATGSSGSSSETWWVVAATGVLLTISAAGSVALALNKRRR